MTDQLAVSNNSFLAPVVDIEGAVARYNAFKTFVSKVLEKDRDYGEIPGTNKPTLYKPGAEKLGAFFGLRPIFVIQESVNDWTGKDHIGEPFFFREYKVQLFKAGELVGEGIGSCNSWEKKYRYRWVNEMEVPANIDKSKLEFVDGEISEFGFAIDKAETTGKYGKPAVYWKQFSDAIAARTATPFKRATKSGKEMDAWKIGGKLYAVPNHDPADQVNTIDKMAQKRAFVAAILIATNASDYFTQDMEDFIPETSIATQPIEAHFAESKPEEKTEPPAPTTERPYSPAALKERIQIMVDSLEGKTCTEGQRTSVKLNLVSMAGGEDNGHTLLKWLVGNAHTSELTDAQILALGKWIHVTKDADGQWIPDELSVQEAHAAFEEALKAQGQQSLL